VADLSGDANLMTCYVGEPDQLRDVHSIVACKVAGVSYEEFRRRLKKGTEAEAKLADNVRQSAKRTLFSWLYGSSAVGLSETLSSTESVAQEYMDALNAQFPGLAKWKADIETFTERHGYAPLMHNTRRHLAKQIMSDDKWEASKARRQASNAAIQSSCALQLKQVMSMIWDSRLLDDYDFQWYLPVHDEVVVSIGVDDLVEVVRQLHQIMCAPFLENVPSASSIGLGKNFGELVELGEVFDADLITSTIVDIFNKKD
jgi:DNA polymerase I-like protein with 3'-5' exonuclease and polymerase domains